ncbi:prolyl oligopeptidase family serine peptidase [Thiolapillus brandeum]|uniref:prolyl oligopeptidase n=1 Tax=Thiolapillus brandeum TaxID=1076588 RepID=A0A7U6GJJ5_9GAMM|nr:prolyl oligopeptidase family serine peptidase [Thiolapillus brandeum]BAO44816.1 prolyl oligopeptidase [Thiolapillus brandeum]
MTIRFPARSAALLLLASTCSAATQTSISYPKAPAGSQVDDYHGTLVADPYRWLEELNSPRTRKWVEAENRLTGRWMEKFPTRETYHHRIEELWNFERYSVPWKQGGRYFFKRNDGLQNQSVVYTLRNLQDQPQVLLDPNKLSKDGTVALSGESVSPDGYYYAYGVSDAGSDWTEWRVRNIGSGKDLKDHLQWIKFSNVSWSADSKGFYYSHYDAPAAGQQLKSTNYSPKLYYHRLGDPQAKDKLVYSRPEHKDWSFGATATDDGHYLLISVSRGTEEKNLLYYQDLQHPNQNIRPLIEAWQASYTYLGNHGSRFWFLSNDQAPKGRILEIDLDHPASKNWKEIVPQSRDTIETASMIDNSFIVSYLHDAWHKIIIHPLHGQPRELELPGMGSANGFQGRRTDRETFYSWTSFNTPARIYHLDMETGQSRLFKAPRLKFDPDDYVTRQIFYKSKDGTRIPMFISHRKDLEPDGKTPTLLYGYGGFNISLTPWFSVSRLVWMEAGGIYAVPNLRGGGEYGEDWHQAGIKTRKQNVFDDFIAAGEWLVTNGYTTPRHLGIMGGSNGGLLVGAVLLQRPDLFAAALPAVGVMDMLRFNKFTIGWAWESDYGSPDNEEEFKALYAYSPYHNVRKGVCYPPTLVTTADHDDRVFPAHSFKFTAALQAAQSCENPVLIRIETRAGHGAGKPTRKRIEEAADTLAFLDYFLKRQP